MQTNPLKNRKVPAYQVLFSSPKRRDYCVVIPVINEGERIVNFLERMKTCAIPDVADIVIIDGGSTDGSLAEPYLKSAGVRTLLLKKDPGQLSAQLRCAYAFALDENYHGVVTIDGNNKDDPAAIPHFVQKLVQGVDFVQASRFIAGGLSENTPWIRDLAIRWIHAPLLSLASGFHWTDTTQGFRAYRREILQDDDVAIFRDIFMKYELLAYLSYKVPRLGYRCQEVPTTRRYPKGKIPTKISGFKGNLDVFGVLIKTCLGVYDPS